MAIHRGDLAAGVFFEAHIGDGFRLRSKPVFAGGPAESFNPFNLEVLAKPREVRGFLGVSEVNARPRGDTPAA